MHHSLGRLYKAWRGAGRLARLDMATWLVVAGHETQERRAGGDYCPLKGEPRLMIILDGSPADYFGVGVRSLMGHEIRGCRREQQQSRTRDDARAIHTVASRLSALRSNGAAHMNAQVTGAVVFAQSALYVI